MLVLNLLSSPGFCTGSLSWLPATTAGLAFLFLPSAQTPAPVPNPNSFFFARWEGSGWNAASGVLSLEPPRESGRAKPASGRESVSYMCLNKVLFPVVVLDPAPAPRSRLPAVLVAASVDE